jgi:DNA polymerase-3 subunit epsilon
LRGFAVIDLETTGFSWVDGDRVIEVGVITLDPIGAPTGGWTTLVDPGRSVAATRIHRISDRDVAHAPRFAEIAGLLAASCADRVLVAHNLAFDSYFLHHELLAAGFDVGLGPRAGVCTMELAGHYMPGVSRALDPLCKAAGIDIKHRHWALWDAEATGRLLQRFIAVDPAFHRHWRDGIDRSLAVRWPAHLKDGAHLLPRCPPTSGHPDDDWCATCVQSQQRRLKWLGGWPRVLAARLRRA